MITTPSASIAALLPIDKFTTQAGITHLCSGGESAWLRSHSDVFATFERLKSAGFDGRESILEEVENCRSLVAELWQTSATRIAFTPSCAEAMASVVHGLDWRPGDNVVTTALEFPSVGWAWRALEQKGVEVRRVAHRDWLINEQDLINAVDDRTRVLAVSQVSFYTGQQLAIQTLREGIGDSKTLLAVDATHASGALPVTAELSDVCMSSSYKWMLSTTGVASMFVSERAQAQLRPSAYGWRNLEVFDDDFATTPQQQSRVRPMPWRFEPGNPALLPILTLANGLRTILDVGIDTIDRHVRDLSAQVSAVYSRLGLQDVSPARVNQRSGNTSFRFAEAETLMHRLAKQGVLVWGGEGRLRVSTHLYNSSDDVKRLEQELTKIQTPDGSFGIDAS